VAVPTLTKGATITVTTKEAPMAPGSKMMMGSATVTDAAGTVARVVAPNYFTGGFNSFGCSLGPDGRSGQAPATSVRDWRRGAAAPPPPPALCVRPAAARPRPTPPAPPTRPRPLLLSPPGKSTIHGIDKVLGLKPAAGAAAKPAAAAAAKPAAAKPAAAVPAGANGRKLMQGGRSRDADTASTFAQMASRDAIISSVSGGTPLRRSTGAPAGSPSV
jgi:hypothetical protein